MDNNYFTIKNSDEFKDVIEYVENKFYEFIFQDGKKIKTICDEEDEPYFDLEYSFYLALAKKLYSGYYNNIGIMNKADELATINYYVKLVKKGMKLFENKKKEEAKKKEQEEIKKHQHEKYVRKKIGQKERKRKELVKTITEAIRLSKEEG